jgi:hypothetical protein
VLWGVVGPGYRGLRRAGGGPIRTRVCSESEVLQDVNELTWGARRGAHCYWLCAGGAEIGPSSSRSQSRGQPCNCQTKRQSSRQAVQTTVLVVRSSTVSESIIYITTAYWLLSTVHSTRQRHKPQAQLPTTHTVLVPPVTSQLALAVLYQPATTTELQLY